jgi:N-ethylmaleimide reductase
MSPSLFDALTLGDLKLKNRIQRLSALDLGYVHIMDGLAFDFHRQGEPMTLAEFRAHYKGVIIGNCGYTREDAEQRIAAGDADMAFWYTPGPGGYTDSKPYSA